MLLLQGEKKSCTEEKCFQLESQLDTNRPQPPPDCAADDIVTVQCCHHGTEISVKLLRKHKYQTDKGIFKKLLKRGSAYLEIQEYLEYLH